MPPKTREGKSRALANLVQYRRPGHDRHGVFAVTPDQPDTWALAQRIMDILSGEPAAVLRPPDEIGVNVLACLLRRLDQADKFLSKHGLVNQKGQLRPVAGLVPQIAREALAYLTALGMTPQARAKLGLTTGKAFDLAEEIAKLGGDNDGARDSGQEADGDGASAGGREADPERTDPAES